VVVALVSGIVLVAMVNPIAAAMISKFDRLEGKYISGRASLLSISPSGLWLRQVGEEGIRFRGEAVPEYILHAMRMDQSSLRLNDVNIFLFDATHRFLGRIDAPSATLKAGQWSLTDATLSAVDVLPQQAVEYHMPTQLTLSQIQDSFSAPETFSFWQLPAFIGVLEKAGFSAMQHRLHFHGLMAMPLLLAGMLMLSAVFSLRNARRGRTGMVIVIGIVVGYLFYFAANVIYTLGASGSLPIVLAAWAPALVVVMFASAALLHLEDG
jgi:lipopolysaccharide export system permease protein